MSFDFSAYKTNPPPGCTVLEAASELRLRTSTGTIFIVREEGGTFFLWTVTEVDKREQLSFAKKELHRILRLLGYRQGPNELHNVKERII